MPKVIFFDMFFRKVQKIYVELYYLKERFNKIEIEIGSKNERQLKRIRKPLLPSSQEESLVEKVKKYPCLFEKKSKNVQRKIHFSELFLIQNLCSLFPFDYFFQSFKNKNNIISNSSVSISVN